MFICFIIKHRNFSLAGMNTASSNFILSEIYMLYSDLPQFTENWCGNDTQLCRHTSLSTPRWILHYV